ncbi:unnamed protein product [Brassica oleracea]
MQCVDLEIIIWKLHFEVFPQHINRPLTEFDIYNTQ